MRVLITGGSGRLGKDLEIEFNRGHTVLAPAHNQMDITDFEAVRDYFELNRPDILIHSAAEADADVCELDPSKAYFINTLATQNLASACLSYDTTMVFISTDYVFDGYKGSPYTEFDLTNPLNVYGQSKLAAESFVRDYLQKYFIIRTAWLFGIHGNNFLTGVIKAAETGTTVKAAVDQFGSPTSTSDLSKALVKLIETPFYGVYNVVNRGSLNWYDYAQLILSVANKEAQIEPILREARGPAPRPYDTTLEPLCLDLRNIYDMPDIKDAIQACLKEIL